MRSRFNRALSLAGMVCRRCAIWFLSIFLAPICRRAWITVPRFSRRCSATRTASGLPRSRNALGVKHMPLALPCIRATILFSIDCIPFRLYCVTKNSRFSLQNQAFLSRCARISYRVACPHSPLDQTVASRRPRLARFPVQSGRDGSKCRPGMESFLRSHHPPERQFRAPGNQVERCAENRALGVAPMCASIPRRAASGPSEKPGTFIFSVEVRWNCERVGRQLKE